MKPVSKPDPMVGPFLAETVKYEAMKNDAIPVAANCDGEVEALVEADAAVVEVEAPINTLARFASYVPAEVIEFVRSLTRTEWLAACTLETVDEHICHRLGVHTLEHRRNRWNGAWTKKRRSVERRLRRARDEQARLHQTFHITEHETYWTLPGFFKPWRPDSNGCLVINDPEQVNPSIGSASFLEQTPAKLLRWVHQTWASNRSIGLTEDGDVDMSSIRSPKVWDLTCGSGTSLDYFQRIHGFKVLGRDLTLVASGVECGCVSTFGKSDNITGHEATAGIRSTNVIRHPDIILFDPPSRGTPSHAQLYGEGDPRDLANADRASWIEVTTLIAKSAATYLARDGVLSFLVRHGARDGGNVVPDPLLLADVKLELQKPGPGTLPPLGVAHEIPITYGRRRNQTSLGQARVPSTHLLLVRAS
ncbi:MAG: hypothetical protein ABI895_29215 [Deltaproteobacteria bacterium]